MVEQVLLNLARNAMQAMDEARVPPPRSLVLQVRATPAPPRSASAGWSSRWPTSAPASPRA
jgi:two-component system sensor histidine kinase DctS